MADAGGGLVDNGIHDDDDSDEEDDGGGGIEIQ